GSSSHRRSEGASAGVAGRRKITLCRVTPPTCGPPRLGYARHDDGTSTGPAAPHGGGRGPGHGSHVIVLLLLHAVVGAAVFVSGRTFGRALFVLAAIPLLSTFVWLLFGLPRVLDGEVHV